MNILDGIELGIGTWAWGDRLFWGFGRGYQEVDILAAFRASLSAGITFFDTAETYGQGSSEVLLGRMLREVDPATDLPFAETHHFKVATKFMPFPWRLTRGSLKHALQGSLKRLNVEKVALYQIHWPTPPVRVETWMAAMADAFQAGQIEAVGVSNYDHEHMQRAVDTLRREGIPLASNQVSYSLLNRKVEKNGLLQRCRELGVTLIAYSPLAQGVLTGKYTPANPLTGVRATSYGRKLLERVQPLLRQMERVGSAHEGKTIAQVALNWCICKGTLPIPGAKNEKQARQNAGSTGWRLTEAEISLLDSMSDQVDEK
jgi:aryl-alcohol dehydrogenase-like predicted oxidoreductase